MDVHGFNFDDWEIVFIYPDIHGLGGWMTEFDNGADILGRDFESDRIERDCGIVFHQAVKCLKEERIDFIPRKPSDRGIFKIAEESVQRSLEDAVMKSAMVLFVQPIGKEVVKLIERIICLSRNQR